MITIFAKLVGHELSIISSPTVSSNSYQNDSVHFIFDDAWDGLVKTALFWPSGADEPYGSLVNDDGVAIIPRDVILEKGTIRFGVYGEEPSDLSLRITSTIAKYKINDGAWSDKYSNSEGEIPESLFEQLKALVYSSYDKLSEYLNTAEDTLESYLETAEEAFNHLDHYVPIVVTFGPLNETSTYYEDTRITEDMVVINSVLSNPSAQRSDLTVTTADGSVTVIGSISGTTNITLYLVNINEEE